MKKWKGSAVAKAAAWVLLSLCAVLCVASAAAIAVMVDENVYEISKEKTRENLFSRAGNRYSLLAAYHYHHGGKTDVQEILEEAGFEYGIIEGDSIEGLDLNSSKTYAESHFSRRVTEEEAQIFYTSMGRDTTLYYREGLLGGYAYANSDLDRESVSFYVDAICYDASGGILYYRTLENEYFPVQRVALYRAAPDVSYNVSYQFDFDTKQYRLLEEERESDGTDNTAEKVAEILEGTVDRENSGRDLPLTQKTYFNFRMLEEAGMPREEWGTFLLDGVREIDAAELTPINIEDKVIVTETTDYYLDPNYTLRVIYSGKDIRDYIVVSLWPDKVPEGWSDNLFAQAEILANLMYTWRYPALIVCILSLLAGIGLFCFLLAAAGHRKDTEEIVLLPADKLWLDVLAILIFAGEMILLAIVLELGNPSLISPYICLFVFLGLCMGWLFLWFVLSFAVRVKKGKWWRNTLIYQAFTFVGRFVKMVWQNMGFLWRWLLVMAVLAIFELSGIVTFSPHNTEILLFVWFLEKVLLYTLIIWGLVQMKMLKEGGERIASGDFQYKINTNGMNMDFKRHGENINSISQGMARAVEERMKSERFKTELITNVSHDIKTPLTSIINYVDLLEKEKLENATAEEYLEVLERQSGRLKKLIEDLIEASKASTGNLAVHLERLEAGVFMVQTVGEFEEKTKAARLDLQISKPEHPVYIMADGRHFWRVIDNLMNNICKYAQPDTRVYIDMEIKKKRVEITFRNISKYPLNISSEALMERFVRGDSSRNTEGSGLGLSIANSLMEIMGGSFQLYVDGDLFKVILEFDEAEPPSESADDRQEG